MDRIFPFCKRVGRFRYFSFHLLIFSIFISLYPITLKIGPDSAFGIIVVPAIALFSFIFHVSLVFQRTMDIGGRPYWGLLAFVPFVNVFFGLGLMFWKGSEGSNYYGSKPCEKYLYSSVVILIGVLLIAYSMSILPPSLGER